MTGNDAQLVRRSLRGDRAAFGELVRRHQDRLYNTVFRVLGHADDARDVVQDALIRAFKNLGQFKGDSQFFTWLYRIAVNAALSHKRRRQGGVKMSDSSAEWLLDGEPADASNSRGPAASLERADDERQLQAALMQLPADFRVALVLRDIEGHPYEEIAQILEVPVGTIRSRIHRARIGLRNAVTGGPDSLLSLPEPAR